MKKTQITLLVAFASLLFIFSSCSKKSNKDTDPPASGILLHAGAIIISNGNPNYATSISIGLVDLNHSGIGIEGAIVQVNGLDIPDLGSGSYNKLLTENPITAGTTVTLVIKCTAGDFTVSAVMPASGKSIQVDIPGCAAGSTLSMGNNI